MDPKPDYGEKTYKGHNRLEGKVAVVTGGDSGIGRAVCLAFAREGADVLVSYYNEHDDAHETKRVVEAAGRQCVLVAGDLSEEAACKSVIDEAVKRWGRVDILVNNASFQGKATESIRDIDYNRLMFTFRTNIMAMFVLVQAALPHMKPGAAIINVGSIQAYQPSSGILDYATTKGAIVNFTKGLAPTLLKEGIRVNCIAPGPVWTPLVAQSFPKEKLETFGQNYPIGRPAQPAELAPSFVFLASDDSRFVNGEVLGVTGGAPLP